LQLADKLQNKNTNLEQVRSTRPLHLGNVEKQSQKQTNKQTNKQTHTNATVSPATSASRPGHAPAELQPLQDPNRRPSSTLW